MPLLPSPGGESRRWERERSFPLFLPPTVPPRFSGLPIPSPHRPLSRPPLARTDSNPPLARSGGDSDHGSAPPPPPIIVSESPPSFGRSQPVHSAPAHPRTHAAVETPRPSSAQVASLHPSIPSESRPAPPHPPPCAPGSSPSSAAGRKSAGRGGDSSGVKGPRWKRLAQQGRKADAGPYYKGPAVFLQPGGRCRGGFTWTARSATATPRLERQDSR